MSARHFTTKTQSNASTASEAASTCFYYYHMAQLKMHHYWYYGKQRFFNYWNFHSSWTTYLCVMSLVFGGVISGIDNLPYVDGLFLAVSAITGTGLSTVSVRRLSGASFGVLGFLMIVGGIIFLLLPTPLFRRYFYRKLKNKVTAIDDAILSEHNALYNALGAYWKVTLCYIIFFHIIGICGLYGALYLYENHPELQERHYPRIAYAVFLSVSAFANAGFSLTVDSVTYLKNNPLAYFILSLLILAGNTAAPVVLRGVFTMLCKRLTRKHADYAAYKYIIDNPRRISTHIFGQRETMFLCASIVGLNLVQFVFYLGSTLNRVEATDEYGSQSTLVGMGYFQTISTRSAGLQIMSLRYVNQGMLVVYVVMMYLSAAPFVSTMYKSEQDAELAATGPQDEDSSDEEEEMEAPVAGALSTQATMGKSMRRRGSGGSIASIVELIKPESVTKKFAVHFLMRHSFFLMVAVFVCAFSEDDLLTRHPESVNLWFIVFEIISAYGNVGLSLGFPGEQYALCGRFNILGKVIIMMVMMLGKHRGLPHAQDAVIDFKFSRFKRYSRRASRAMRNSRAAALSAPPPARRKLQRRHSSGAITKPSIAIIELKPKEKIKLRSSISIDSSSPAKRVFPEQPPPSSLKRFQSERTPTNRQTTLSPRRQSDTSPRPADDSMLPTGDSKALALKRLTFPRPVKISPEPTSTAPPEPTVSTGDIPLVSAGSIENSVKTFSSCDNKDFAIELKQSEDLSSPPESPDIIKVGTRSNDCVDEIIGAERPTNGGTHAVLAMKGSNDDQSDISST